MDKGQLAKDYFKSGLNCSQSVAMAFKDEMGLTEEQVKKLSIAFGGGFGRTRSVCGAVSGMTMVIGMLGSDGEDKLSVYAIEQKALELFKNQLGSTICAELLEGNIKVDKGVVPAERTEEFYKKRPCAEICALASTIAYNLLREKGKI